MTAEQSKQIKAIVDAHGWKAVHAHPILGPLWRKSIMTSKEWVDKNVGR